MSPEWVGFCYGILGGMAIGVMFCQIVMVWMDGRRKVDRAHTHYLSVGDGVSTKVIHHSHRLPHDHDG